MTLLSPRTEPRILYIIAPSLHQCHRTAMAHGLTPPAILNARNITSAYQLRGVTAGTPFITWGRECWGDTTTGFELDAAVTAYQRTGRLRIAQPDDLDACKLYDGMPARETSGLDARGF